MASNNKKNNKKAVVDYSAKREKMDKDFILIPVTNNEIVDGVVNGFVYIEKIKQFGKEYFKCENKVSSL